MLRQVSAPFRECELSATTALPATSSATSSSELGRSQSIRARHSLLHPRPRSNPHRTRSGVRVGLPLTNSRFTRDSLHA